MKRFLNRIIENAICLTVLSGAAVMSGICLVSCSKSEKKSDVEHLVTQIMTNPVKPGLKILAYSEVDSVFGTNYISDSEMETILSNLISFNSSNIFHSPEALDDPKAMAKVESGIELSETIRKYGNTEEGNPDFSGFKIKVLYQYLNSLNDTVRSERYFILDKEKKHVINSFDIPIL